MTNPNEVNAENIQRCYNLIVNAVANVKATKNEHERFDYALEILKTAIISYINISQMETKIDTPDVD